MHVSRSVDPARHIVYTTITGEITVAEVRADLLRLAADSKNQPNLPGIIDMRKAEAQLTADEIQQLAGFVVSHPQVVNSTRRALLVATDVMFGLYRMFATFAGNASVEFQVFRDEQKALEWVMETAGQQPQHA
ncbi:MAG TPA: STAS/SEC14 domain-containing protein [Verrucomicrobiae bacterium]|jgi:hypothetical protein|nr:STAS/SEC14 domain-containing protein [Verrucomicrobiae bacterium]